MVVGEVGCVVGNYYFLILLYGLFYCWDGVVQLFVGSEGLWCWYWICYNDVEFIGI